MEYLAPEERAEIIKDTVLLVEATRRKKELHEAPKTGTTTQ